MIAAHRHRHGLMFPKSAAFRLEPQILGNDGIAALSPGVRLVDQDLRREWGALDKRTFGN
jgi:hypothetical protein